MNSPTSFNSTRRGEMTSQPTAPTSRGTSESWGEAWDSLSWYVRFMLVVLLSASVIVVLYLCYKRFNKLIQRYQQRPLKVQYPIYVTVQHECLADDRPPKV